MPGQRLDIITGTAAALGTSRDLSGLGLPFRSLRFTKSAAVQSATVRVGASPAGVMLDITVNGGETLLVTASVDGVNFTPAICVRNNAGVASAATALATGVYTIVME